MLLVASSSAIDVLLTCSYGGRAVACWCGVVGVSVGDGAGLIWRDGMVVGVLTGRCCWG